MRFVKYFRGSEGTEADGVYERLRWEDDDEFHLDGRGGRLPLDPLTTEEYHPLAHKLP